jgi:ferredoxin
MIIRGVPRILPGVTHIFGWRSPPPALDPDPHHDFELDPDLCDGAFPCRLYWPYTVKFWVFKVLTRQVYVQVAQIEEEVAETEEEVVTETDEEMVER